MKTLVASSTETVESAVTHHVIVRKFLLICGILYFPLYFAGHVLAGMQFKGYSHIDQQVSELSAIGAPTRPLLTAFLPIYLALAIAFGIGVWGAAGHKRSLRIRGDRTVGIRRLRIFGMVRPDEPAGSREDCHRHCPLSLYFCHGSLDRAVHWIRVRRRREMVPYLFDLDHPGHPGRRRLDGYSGRQDCWGVADAVARCYRACERL